MQIRRYFFLFLLLSTFLTKAQILTPAFQVPPGDTICLHTQAIVVLSSSSGDSIQVVWGDGNSNTYTGPYGRIGNVYDTLGRFTIIFTAYQGGSFIVDSLHITVIQPPLVDFTYSFTDTCAKPNLQVQFTDMSAPGLTNYSWNFGDGTIAGTSAQQNPAYTYALPSNYVVSLTAQNNECPNTKIKTVELPFDTTLVTGIIANDTCPCNVINFTATGNATNWFWNLGDGTTALTQSVQHTYTEPGNYLVTVTGTDPISGCYYTISKSVDVCPNDLNVFPTKSNNNWFFYNNCGLNFSGAVPVFNPGGQMNAVPGEGGATISHPTTGALLFYTNGQKVWDKNHNQMPNGFGLNGNNSSTESALIIPVPGNINRYYIFTSSGASSGQMGCFYSIVDLTLNAGNGNVINKNTPFFPKSSFQPEALKGIVKKEAINCTNAEYWVIIPTSRDTFRSYLVTSAGIAAPIVNSMVNPSIPNQMNRAVMSSASAPNGKMYAIIEGDLTGTKNRVRLMTFDPLTGNLSNQIILTPGIPALYGLTFSPDNSKLYAGGEGYIIQYDLLKNYHASILPISAYGLVRIMQIGQDNKIYFVVENRGHLGVINSPNIAGTACNMNENGVFLNGNTTLQGLQNFIPLRFSIPDTAQASFSVNTGTVCSLSLTLNNLSPTLPAPDSCSFFANDTIRYFWDFGDGNTSTLYQPGSHTYAVPGNYTIKLVVSRKRTCTADSTIQNVTVASAPPTTTITPLPSCDSALYNGNWYYNSQTIPDTIFGGASNGCDSIINTLLTINNSSTFTITPLSCGNYLSPGGNIYTSSGTYIDTLSSSSGCDSMITVNLTVIDSVVSNVNTTACDSTNINGNWYFNSQLVRDTLTGAAQNGCDSIVKTNLTITNSVSSNNNIVICQGQSALIHGVNQNANGVYTQTFPAANGCDSISAVNLTVNPNAISGTTITACDSTFANSTWYYASQTLVDTMNGASSEGCDSIHTIAIIINQTPTLTISPQTDSIYSGTSITLNAAGAAVYSWNNGSTTTSITVNPIQNTNYCVIGMNSNCPDTICAMVYVLECASGKLFVPTAFSPNSDGQNDELCIYGTACIKTLQLTIYDRWGEIVFKTNTPTDCWNGIYRNKKMDSAVFTFSLNAVTTTNENIALSGNITLVK